ncbi:hypothetical protein I4F81_001183 [Pyropia yezoensis]|uniref:Uncharacterized protein n=1 Tax=Pyropia yezoensis TaxID=2788 RepID=A0ACC3BM63_PYRYE|nr:hypothetical protein I4F81_001183 [Neopyropia yezoensis]
MPDVLLQMAYGAPAASLAAPAADEAGEEASGGLAGEGEGGATAAADVAAVGDAGGSVNAGAAATSGHSDVEAAASEGGDDPTLPEVPIGADLDAYAALVLEDVLSGDVPNWEDAVLGLPSRLPLLVLAADLTPTEQEEVALWLSAVHNRARVVSGMASVGIDAAASLPVPPTVVRSARASRAGLVPLSVDATGLADVVSGEADYADAATLLHPASPLLPALLVVRGRAEAEVAASALLAAAEAQDVPMFAVADAGAVEAAVSAAAAALTGSAVDGGDGHHEVAAFPPTEAVFLDVLSAGVGVLHGGISQPLRDMAAGLFRTGAIRVLVFDATLGEAALRDVPRAPTVVAVAGAVAAVADRRRGILSGAALAGRAFPVAAKAGAKGSPPPAPARLIVLYEDGEAEDVELAADLATAFLGYAATLRSVRRFGVDGHATLTATASLAAHRRWARRAGTMAAATAAEVAATAAAASLAGVDWSALSAYGRAAAAAADAAGLRAAMAAHVDAYVSSAVASSLRAAEPGTVVALRPPPLTAAAAAAAADAAWLSTTAAPVSPLVGEGGGRGDGGRATAGGDAAVVVVEALPAVLVKVIDSGLPGQADADAIGGLWDGRVGGGLPRLATPRVALEAGVLRDAVDVAALDFPRGVGAPGGKGARPWGTARPVGDGERRSLAAVAARLVDLVANTPVMGDLPAIRRRFEAALAAGSPPDVALADAIEALQRHRRWSARLAEVATAAAAAAAAADRTAAAADDARRGRRDGVLAVLEDTVALSVPGPHTLTLTLLGHLAASLPLPPRPALYAAACLLLVDGVAAMEPPALAAAIAAIAADAAPPAVAAALAAGGGTVVTASSSSYGGGRGGGGGHPRDAVDAADVFGGAAEGFLDDAAEYYLTKREELDGLLRAKADNLRRLEAQRNVLNARVRALREELQLLHEPGSYVGEVVKIMGKTKLLVKVNPEGKYVVDLDPKIAMADVKVGARVALRNDSYTLHKVLPSKVDPLISLMRVEKVPDSTYEMIGGLETQIKEIKEVIELPIKHPELFDALGIAQPKGVLLYGPPGTGKTLLARAVAHHTECTFIRVSGSELVQKYIGEGSRMVRELFVMAREHAPSIIFMDEIDSIGSARQGSGSGNGDSEVQRTMLELLNQLDGFEPSKNIKVLMATNRIDILDSALLRPGRIDRKIEFPNPNDDSRLSILAIHSRKMNLMRQIDLSSIAAKATGASGAEMKAICTEAGMYALRERRVHVTQDDFDLAVAKVMRKDSEANMSIKKLFK